MTNDTPQTEEQRDIVLSEAFGNQLDWLMMLIDQHVDDQDLAIEMQETVGAMMTEVWKFRDEMAAAIGALKHQRDDLIQDKADMEAALKDPYSTLHPAVEKLREQLSHDLYHDIMPEIDMSVASNLVDIGEVDGSDWFFAQALAEAITAVDWEAGLITELMEGPDADRYIAIAQKFADGLRQMKQDHSEKET